MTFMDAVNGLLGGLLIGVAVTLMLMFNGRVTGIAGIIFGLFSLDRRDFLWRLAFLGGLILSGALGAALFPQKVGYAFEGRFSLGYMALAGFIVGFSTVLGSGCTSGHGVCGMSRLSRRSIVGTLVFMFSGFLTVAVMRLLGILNT